jgi:hypothetical protein
MTLQPVFPLTSGETGRVFTLRDAAVNLCFGNSVFQVVLHRPTWTLAILPHGTEIGCSK